jgi:cadmium resistance protein CadD (predicted permease)
LLICAGLGVGLFLFLVEGIKQAGLGLIPLFIGIGYLVVAKLEADRPAEQASLS